MECFAYYENEDPWDFIKNCSEFEQQIYQGLFYRKTSSQTVYQKIYVVIQKNI